MTDAVPPSAEVLITTADDALQGGFREATNALLTALVSGEENDSAPAFSQQQALGLMVNISMAIRSWAMITELLGARLAHVHDVSDLAVQYRLIGSDTAALMPKLPSDTPVEVYAKVVFASVSHQIAKDVESIIIPEEDT